MTKRQWLPSDYDKKKCSLLADLEVQFFSLIEKIVYMEQLSIIQIKLINKLNLSKIVTLEIRINLNTFLSSF
jgi:hypothetical protein